MQPFLQECARVGRECLSLREPLVVGHYDCDGLSSTAVILNSLRSQGIPAESMTVKRLDDATLDSVFSKSREVIFTDFGSGSVSKLEEKAAGGSKAIIIDHHHPEKPGSKIVHLNPHLHGFDGGIDCSSASLAALCFCELKNSLNYQLGLVGAVGDVQSENGFVSLNKFLLEEAKSLGVVREERDLRLFGRVSRPLLSFLEFSEPFIPGVSGSSKKAAIFLDENEIPFQDGEKQLSFYDLPEGARRKLRGALLLQAQKTLKNPKAVFGSVYLFPGEPRNSELYDAQEFSTLLNACGRHGKEETGIKACLHDEEAIAIARKTMQLHRAMIRNGLHHFFKHALDFGAFFFFDGRGLVEDTVIGTVAGSSQLAKSEEKPVIAISIDENKQVKVSGRASKALVEKGLNLSALMKKASEGIGFGGGHAMAAGASVKAEALEDFLLSAKREIKAQVKK